MSPDTVPVTHPSWCSPKHCTISARGARSHRSQQTRARSARTDLTVTTQLFQDLPIDSYPDSDIPLIDLTIRFPDYGSDHPSEDYSFCFDSELAQAVGRMLLTTGRQAARPPAVQHG
jgi:hypothetical protein